MSNYNGGIITDENGDLYPLPTENNALLDAPRWPICTVILIAGSWKGSRRCAMAHQDRKDLPANRDRRGRRGAMVATVYFRLSGNGPLACNIGAP
jgi:hypothetical protein